MTLLCKQRHAVDTNRKYENMMKLLPTARPYAVLKIISDYTPNQK